MYRLPVLTLLCVLGTSACGDRSASVPAEDTPEEERYGGTAVAALSADIPTLNPLTSQDMVGQDVIRHVLFTPVVRLDENLNAVPALARSWELRPLGNDSSELVFHLRDDVYWHDGVKTTAYDLERLFELGGGPADYRGGVAVDSFTFKARFEPRVDYISHWRGIVPVPRHLVTAVPENAEEDPYGVLHPVGNGPFRFRAHEPGKGWSFEANPEYPADLGGRPYLDRIEYRVIADSAALLRELEAGRVDYALNLAPEQGALLSDSEQVRLNRYPGLAYRAVLWNNRREPFRDVRIRRALTHAIDRRGILDSLFRGRGQIANTPVPPLHWAYEVSVGEDLGYDPRRARLLLEEAGWTDRDGDGVIEDAKGTPFRFTLVASRTGGGSAQTLHAIRRDLRRVGIEVEIQELEIGEMIRKVVRARDFDAAHLTVTTEPRLNHRNHFHCERTGHPMQISGYCDPAMDRLLDTLQLVFDRREARPLWREYQETMAREQPYTFLFFLERAVGVSRRLRGVSADVRGEWVNAPRWWIAPAERDAAAASALE